jgi:CRISPR-associated endoribonuclease Cas6
MAERLLDFEKIWFPFTVFEVIYEAKPKEKIFPPKEIYSLFRGIFGKKLRQISCALRSVKSCAECKLNLSCPYGYLFETVKPPDADRLKKYPYLPHPFSFYIPYPLPQDGIIKIGILLVGKGIYFFPHIVLALKMVSENFYPKKFSTFKFLRIINPLTGEDLTDSEKIKIPELIKWKDALSEPLLTLKIKTVSPLELKFQGKVVFPESFKFSVLIRNLLRRISTLAYFHCQKEIQLDFKKIIELAEEVKTQADLKVVKIKRKSQRTGQIYPLYGLIGEATFEGELLKEFYPLLLLGSFIQVGKHTSFGFGKYEIIF